MSSSWCDINHWYTNQKLTQKSKNLPVNEIDDIQIDKEDYVYSIVDNTCFNRIPSLKCKNINIVLTTGSVAGDPGSSFYCANLAATNVVIGLQNITCTHWNSTEFCNWDISTLSMTTDHKTTILHKIILSSLSSGSLDRTTIDQCYIKSDILDLWRCNIFGSKDTPTYISCSTGTIRYSSTNNDYSYWDGNFTVSRTYLKGSGQGKFDFLLDSENYSSIVGETTFGERSFNTGTLKGNAIFSGGSINKGIIVGDCIFSGSGTVNYGTISGASIFADGAINYGTITQPSIFSSYSTATTYNPPSINYGTLKEFATFNNSINAGLLKNGAKFFFSQNFGSIISGDIVFIKSSNNSPLYTPGNISFIDGSYNNQDIFIPVIKPGTIDTISTTTRQIGSNPVVFDSHSANAFGYILRLAIFGTGCSNSGVVRDGLFNSSSYNKGTITNIGTFNDFSRNAGYIDHTGLFYASSLNGGFITDVGKFYAYSYNFSSSDNILPTAIFYDSSVNSGFINYGLFYNNALNGNQISQTGMFYNSSQNYGSGNNIIFYNTSRNNATVKSGLFLSNSINATGAIITNNADFDDNSINYGNIFNSENNFAYQFKGNSINNGKIINNSIVLFSGYASNKNYVKNAEFYENAQNQNIGTGYNLNFFNKSINNGYVANIGLFYNDSTNLDLGVVTNGTFYNNSINYSSMRRPLVSGYGFLTSGTRTIKITDQAKNRGPLNNVGVYFDVSGINEGTLKWVFDPLLIYTLSGIYSTGNKPYTFVPTGTFLTNYGTANIPLVQFKNYSINRSDINGYSNVSFEDSSINYGSIYTYPPVPKESLCATFISSMNNGNIQNKTTFSNRAINYGNLFLAEFNNSFNSGTVSDSGSFVNSINYGSVVSGYFQNSINSGTIDIGLLRGSTNYNRVSIGSFIDNSTNTISGIISNSGSFGSKSENKSIIRSPILTFSSDAKNNGRVMEAYFSETAINDSSGSIIGNGDFFGSSSNIGNQVFTLNFHEFSTNQSNSTGNFKFYDTSKNNGILTGKTIFLNNSETNGQCFGDVSLYDSTTNKGLLSGTILLQGSGSNPPTNLALIIGNGNVLLVLAENFGTINGNSLFTSGINKGQIEKGSFFFDSSNAVNGTVSGECKFYNSSVNLGTASTYAFFYNSGYNLGTVSTGIFNNESNNNGTTNIGLFYNNAKNSAIVNSGEFHDSSYNDFSGHDISIAFLYDNSVNYGSINNAYFDNNSTNTGTVSLGTFNNGAKNIGTIEGNGIFNNSTNRGSIKGYATFNSSNCTAGIIDNNALFTNSSFCSNTTINGSATFISGSCYDKNTTTIKGNITKPENCNP
jgi:hypothetical protein